MNSEISNQKHDDSTEEDVVRFWSEMPVFPGGEQAMLEFIRKNIIYPDFEKENNIQGKVKVEFTVEIDGSVANFKAYSKRKKRANLENLEKEAVRVVSLLPKFSPAKMQGNPVRITLTIPINFYLIDWKYKLKRFFKSFI
jgi:protein TonB